MGRFRRLSHTITQSRAGGTTSSGSGSTAPDADRTHGSKADQPLPGAPKATSSGGGFFTTARPHQGIDQRIPLARHASASDSTGKIIAFPVLNGLHHDYRRVA